MQIKYYQGSEKLKTGIFRLTHKKPLEAFKTKISLEKAKNAMQRSFGLKDKFIKRHWREYLLKWRKICADLKIKDLKDDLHGKLVKNLLSKHKYKVLSNEHFMGSMVNEMYTRVLQYRHHTDTRIQCWL